jgi:large subunit ribosomal protein L9
MDGLSIAISASVSEEGTLYGSIGTREIADALNEKGFEVEKSAVRLPEGALKELGEYSLDIELHPEVIRSITIQITALEEN